MENRKLKAAAAIAGLIEEEKDPEIRTSLEMAQNLLEKDGKGLLLYLSFAEKPPYFKTEKKFFVTHGGIGESASEVENQTNAHTGSDAIVPGYPMPFTLEEYPFRLKYFDPKQWWTQALYNNKAHILTLAANACRYHIEHSKYTSQQMQRELCHFIPKAESNNVSLHLNCKNHYEADSHLIGSLPFNIQKRSPFSNWYNGKTKCCISNAVASHYVIFHIHTLTDMARLIGSDNIPKFLVGYKSQEHSESDIFEFHFKVGFSKTAMRKILKGESPWKTKN